MAFEASNAAAWRGSIIGSGLKGLKTGAFRRDRIPKVSLAAAKNNFGDPGYGLGPDIATLRSSGERPTAWWTKLRAVG